MATNSIIGKQQINISARQQNSLTKKIYFVGFSTVDRLRPPYTLTDVDLIKRDLNNQFSTPLGSRVMMPNYGTQIPTYLFDPFDEYTRDAIIKDAVSIVESDPRVSLEAIDAYQQDQTITISMVLKFLTNNLTESLYVSFTTANQESF